MVNRKYIYFFFVDMSDDLFLLDMGFQIIGLVDINPFILMKNICSNKHFDCVTGKKEECSFDMRTG